MLILFIGCGNDEDKRVIIGFEDEMNNILPIDTNVSLIINAIYSDNTMQNVVNTLVCKSSDTSLAIYSNGIISTKSIEGNVDISCRSKDKLSNNTYAYEKVFHFNIRRLRLLNINIPTNKIIAKGTQEQIVANGEYEGNISVDITNDVVWNSSNTTIATIDRGLITAKNDGNCTINATLDSIVSNDLNLSVVDYLYDSIDLKSSKTVFNVQQSITLSVEGIKDTNQTQIISSNYITLESNNSNVVSINNQTLEVIALAKGSVRITATYKLNTSLKDSIDLVVAKDKYVRLFKNGNEEDMPINELQLMTQIPNELDSFTLIAVGDNFSIADIGVSDFNQTTISPLVAWFEGLRLNQILYQDQNVTFTLKNIGNQNELNYYFRLNNSLRNDFSQRYQKIE